MSCENLGIPKPITTQCPTSIFGIPLGASGRTVASEPFEIQGIVLHCYAGTIGQLCNELKCKTKSSIISGSVENSYHYGVGTQGHAMQFVQDADISWAFGAYKSNTYANVPPPNVAFNWPTLQAVNGLNTTPDVYVLNVAIALGHVVEATLSGCYECPTASGLPQTQHDELVQLLAYLAEEHNITIDSEHITFHDLIDCGEDQECPCTDIETLLGEVAAFCPPCAGDEAPTAPEAQPDDTIEYIMGITEACCPSSAGCYVKIPWDACFIGDLAVDGTLDSYILGLTQDPVTMQWCLTRGCLATLAPLQGCGTVDDPLGLNLCAFGDWIPDEPAANIVNLVGIDAEGCLIESPAGDVLSQFVPPIEVIDTDCINFEVLGVLNHTLQANIILSSCDDNLLTCEADGLCAQLDCDDLSALFPIGTITNLYGNDGAGGCVSQDASDLVNDAICLIPEDMGLIPTWVLAKDAQDCPVFATVASVVAAGLVIQDTDTIDLTLVGNLLTADAIIDPAGDNILQATANGLYVPDLVPIDSNCISVTYVNRQLVITPIISPTIGGVINVVNCEPTGLYVPRGADALVNGPLTGNGSDTNPLDINFSLMGAQDLCDFGDAVPAGVLVDVLGRDGAGCLRRQAGADVIGQFLIANDTPCIDLSLVGNILTATPVVAPPQAGVANMLTCLPAGLYVPLGAGLTVLDTTCIDIDLTNGVLSATFNLNPAGDNQLTCTPSGAYVPQAAGLIASGTDCIDLDLIGGVLTAQPIIAGPQGGVPNLISCLPGEGLYVPETANLAVVDTTCIDLDLTGGVLSATIIIDPAGDNQITCDPNGLYVPQGAGLTGLDSNCIDVDVTAGVVTANIILAGPQGGVPNILNCIPGEGLYVSEVAGILVNDTTCIELDLTGGVLTAQPILDPTGDNQLTCLPAGLYVPPTAGLVALDTDCITLNLAGDTLTSTPILAPTQGGVPNILQCIAGQGLYVPELDLCDLGERISLEPIATADTDGFVILDPITDCLTHGDRLHNFNAGANPTPADCAAGYTVGSKWIIPAGTLPGQTRDIIWIMVDDCMWERIAGGTWIGADNNLVPEVIPQGTAIVPQSDNVLFDDMGEYSIANDWYVSRQDARIQSAVGIQLDVTVVPAAGADLIIEAGYIINGLGPFFYPVIQRITNPQVGQTYNVAGVTQAAFVEVGQTVQVAIRHNGGGPANLTSYVVNHYDMSVNI